MDNTPLSLLDRLRNPADTLAQAELVDLYSDWLRGKLIFFRIPPQEIDDLYQDSIRVILENIRLFETHAHEGAFRGWLKKILLNRVRAYWKTNQKYPSPAHLDDLLSKLSDPVSEISREWERDHNQAILQRVLTRLQQEYSPNHWRIFQKLVHEGASASRVAQECGVSLALVWTTKSRIYKRIRELVRDLLDDV